LDIPSLAKNKYLPIYSFYLFPKKNVKYHTDYSFHDMKELCDFLKHNVEKQLGYDGIKNPTFDQIDVTWKYKSTAELAYSYTIFLNLKLI
jgi:hypothetical protein